MSPAFITFEGGEGCGKSVQAEMLTEYLRSKGIDVVRTKEPGGTEIGAKLREILVQGDKDKLDYMSEILLYYADRRIHLTTKIWPALAQNKWVISDRYNDSTIAYQYYGYKCKIAKKKLDMMYDMIAGKFFPDLTFILDLDVKEGLSRSFKKAADTEKKELRFENMDIEFHQNMRKGFLAIAKKDSKRYVVIDARGSKEEVHEKIKQIIKERFNI